jgi:hypothetical protein
MFVPEPPTHAVSPYVAQIVQTAACAAVGGALCVLALWRSRRRGSALLLLLIVGSVVASFQEAPLDIFVSAYYPHRHLWTFWETFGRHIPIWATFAWIILFAGAPWFIAQAMKMHPVRQVVWIGVAANVIIDVLIELPGQAAHLYYYYGHQPLTVGGFPLSMAAVNAATTTAIAVAIYLGDGRIHGRAQALVCLAPILAVPASTMSVGLPVFSLVGAGADIVLRYVGVIATLAAAMLAIDGMSRLAERFGLRPDGEPTSARSGAERRLALRRSHVAASAGRQVIER